MQYLNKIIFLAAIAIFSVSCYFDASPPSDEELYDDTPVLVAKLSGVAADSGVAVIYTDAEGTHADRSLTRYVTDSSGNITVALTLAHGTRLADVRLIVDQDGNGSLDASSGDVEWNEVDIDIASDEDAVEVTAELTDTVTYTGG